ncbi:hypothetical protein DITRI_Ditri11bG0172000 [Diplodiscus trichospermus]
MCSSKALVTMGKKRSVSGLTLLFFEETRSSQENSSSIDNGGEKLENSVTTEIKKDMECVVEREEKHKGTTKSCFLMPLHYPLFNRKEYQAMPQWQLDQLFTEYGLISVGGDLDYKRKFAMGAFLWPATGSCKEPDPSPMHGCRESSPKSKKAKMIELLCHLF